MKKEHLINKKTKQKKPSPLEVKEERAGERGKEAGQGSRTQKD